MTEDISPRIPGYARTLRNTEFFGPWAEGLLEGQRVAFMPPSNPMSAVIGDVDPDREQLTGLSMTRLAAGEILPSEDSPRRLDPYVGPAGATLAYQYILNASAKDYPELRLPQVREGLLKLSKSVETIGFLLEGAIEIHWRKEDLTRRLLEQDAQTCLRILQVLEKNKEALRREAMAGPPGPFRKRNPFRALLAYLAGMIPVKWRPAFAAGLAICLCLGGAITAIPVIQDLPEVLISRSWPTTQGYIISAHLEAGYSGQMSMDSSRVMMHQAKIVYQYMTPDGYRTSNRVAFPQQSSSIRIYSRKVVMEFKPGTQVRVRYHPAMAEHALLVPGPSWLWWVGPFMFGFGVLILSIIQGRVKAPARYLWAIPVAAAGVLALAAWLNLRTLKVELSAAQTGLTQDSP